MGEKYETLLSAAEPDIADTASWATAVVSLWLELADSDDVELMRKVVALEKAEAFVLDQSCLVSSDVVLTYS